MQKKKSKKVSVLPVLSDTAIVVLKSYYKKVEVTFTGLCLSQWTILKVYCDKRKKKAKSFQQMI